MQSQLSLTEGVAVSQGRLYPELGSCSVPSSPVVFRAKTRSVSPNLLQDSVRSVSSFKHFKHILNTLKLYIYTHLLQVEHAAAAGPGDAAQHHHVPRPPQRLQVATDSAQITQALDIVISIYSIYSM